MRRGKAMDGSRTAYLTLSDNVSKLFKKGDFSDETELKVRNSTPLHI